MFFKKRNNTPSLGITTAKGFEVVYRKYIAKLCRIAFNQTRDESTAQSIVQNVFTQLWERRDTLAIQGPLENYLVRAVKLAVMDYLRNQSKRRVHLENHLSDYCGTKHCTEELVAFNELETRVNNLTDQLPCQCRKVYELSRKKGLTNKEIASSLLISEKTVEAHLTRALKHLKVNLSEYQT
ncbi:MAG: RNA polymerase sigma-70 factor [Bacteroidota bacterium]